MAEKMEFYLRIENLGVDEIHKRKYKIKDGEEFILGRSPKQANIILVDENVSRTHASIYARGKQIFIKDLESGNGTYVDGERIKNTILKKGQQITLGGFEIFVAKTVGTEGGDAAGDDIEFVEDDGTQVKAAGNKFGNFDLSQGPKLAGSKDDPLWANALNPKGFINLVKTTLMQAKEDQVQFFFKRDYNGSEKTSIVVIVIVQLVAALPGLVWGSLSAPLFAVENFAHTAVGSIVGIYGICYAYNRFRNWMKLEGKRENYFRFYATTSVLTFPFILLGFIPAVGALIGGLGSAVVYIFSLYAFYKIYRPVLVRWLVVMIATGFAIVMALSFIPRFFTPTLDAGEMMRQASEAGKIKNKQMLKDAMKDAEALRRQAEKMQKKLMQKKK